MFIKSIRKFAERFGGAVISVAVHLVIVAILVKMVIFTAPENEKEIEVRVVDVDPAPDPLPKNRPMENLPTEETISTAADPVEMPECLTEDPMALPENSSEWTVHPLQSPVVPGSLFAGRTKEGRAEQLEKFAGGYGEQVEDAVLRSLRWLAARQTDCGRWGGKSKYNKTWHGREWSAVLEKEQRAARLTALSLLAFLAHGETPQSEEFGTVVKSGIQYLQNQQNPETGLFVPLAANRPEKGGEDLGVYAHAQATYALAEAYALTRAPALKQPVEKGLRVIINGQLQTGGWGNWYQQNISDASAVSWQIQALKAASAAGVQMDGLDDAMRHAVDGIRDLYKGEGEWYYRKGPALKTWNRGGPIMSGAMVLGLQLLGRQTDPMVQAGLRYMSGFGVTEWEKAWENPINKSLPATYEWYYNTQAVFQRGGSRWKSWNAKCAPMLIRHQNREGWWRGPGQEPGEETIYSTSLCALALQVYYRNLPTFQTVKPEPPKVTFDDDVVITVF